LLEGRLATIELTSPAMEVMTGEEATGKADPVGREEAAGKDGTLGDSDAPSADEGQACEALGNDPPCEGLA